MDKSNAALSRLFEKAQLEECGGIEQRDGVTRLRCRLDPYPKGRGARHVQVFTVGKWRLMGLAGTAELPLSRQKLEQVSRILRLTGGLNRRTDRLELIYE